MKLQVGSNRVGKGTPGECGICGRMRDTELVDGHHMCASCAARDAMMKCERLHQAGMSNALCNLAMPIALVVALVVATAALDIPVHWDYVLHMFGL